MMRCLGVMLIFFISSLTANGQPVCRTCAAPPVVRKPAPAPKFFKASSRTSTASATASVTIKSLTTPPPFVPGWKELVVKQATYRDEYSAYLKALDLLGYRGQGFGLGAFDLFPGSLLGNGRGASYRGAASYSTERSLAYGGNTDYGYSLKDAVDLYGSLDMNTVFQQASLLTKGAQELARDGHRDFSDRLAEVGVHAARIAEIRERGKAAERMFRATAPAPVTTTTTTRSATEVRPSDEVPAPRSMPEADLPIRSGGNFARTFFQTYAVPQCGKCHSGTDPKGKFSVLDLPKLSEDAKMVVLERILSTDPDKGMPRDSGDAHAPLTRPHKLLWKKFLGLDLGGVQP